MQKILILLLLSSQAALAQHSFIVRITDDNTHQPIVGATVTIPALHLGGISNSLGIVTIAQIPDGNQVIGISYLGYETKKFSLQFPRPGKDTLNVSLELSGETLQNVVISTQAGTLWRNPQSGGCWPAPQSGSNWSLGPFIS